MTIATGEQALAADVLAALALATHITANGNYAGNNADNRDIAHGLGRTPSLLFIVREVTPKWWIMHNGRAKYYKYDGTVYDAVAMDATNFQVDQAVAGMNSSGTTYYFWCFG